MASVEQILGAMEQQITGVCYGLPGIRAFVGTDFPTLKTLMDNVRGGTTCIAVFDRKLTKNTTRWAPIGLGDTIIPATLISTVAPTTIAAGASASLTLSSTITAGDAVSCVLTNGGAAPDAQGVRTPVWAQVAIATGTSTLQTVAAALASQINADAILSKWVTASAAGAVVTLHSKLTSGTLGLASYTGNGGTRVTEIGRRSRELQLITWARSIEDREAVGNAIANMVALMEVGLGMYPAGLSMADGTSGRVSLMNDYLLDDGTGSDTYRRDILVSVDYPVTTIDALYAVLTPPLLQSQVGFFALPLATA